MFMYNTNVYSHLILLPCTKISTMFQLGAIFEVYIKNLNKNKTYRALLRLYIWWDFLCIHREMLRYQLHCKKNSLFRAIK